MISESMPQLVLRRAQFSRLTVSGFLAVFVALMFLTGCVISPRRPVPGSGSPTPTPTPGAATGQLYVSNDSASAILRFGGALTANGTATPTVIKGLATKLNSPQYLFLDAATDTLYVANSGTSSILVFANASTMTGAPAPSREIIASNAAFTSPSDIALDKTRNLLYVVDGFDIFSFANASTINGVVSPAQDMILTFAPQAIFVDGANNRLYAANAAGSQIAIFDAASTLTANVAPTRTVSGTSLNAPSGVLVDSSGRLVVANAGVTGPSITIFSGAATANGTPTPVATITGANTTLNTPNQIVLNTAATGGDLYVADPTAGSIDVFTNLATANANLAPARRLTGTGVTQSSAAPTARGIALDTSR